MNVLVIVGTDKGGFLLRADESRDAWTVEGPLFKGWKVTAAARDEQGRFFVATASMVYGSALHVSDDLKEWRQIAVGPAWEKDQQRKLNQVWTLHVDGDRYYAGVDEAGLFASDDRGETWVPVAGLNEHETRGGWFPGAGGLCAHALLVDPRDPNRIWCGISAVGVFRSDDGGATWHTKNDGIRIVIEDEQHKDIGFCVHGLVADPDDANVIYRREHTGMFRSRDGGDSWEIIENGVPSRFGFPIVMDRSTKRLFIVPMESDEYRLPIDGRLMVLRSDNGGDSWTSASNGLPERDAYMGVLRGAMDVDHLGPCGVYMGTTAGTMHVTSDAGDSWRQLPVTLPRILHVSAYTDA
jgi:photosystem II stability/assembly factor-like uncharacterized protein